MNAPATPVPRPSLPPLIKWSGGKRSELPVLRPLFPSTIHTLIEPFAGGAAVAWDANPNHVVLNDVSPDLMTFYRTIQTPTNRQAMLAKLLVIDQTRKAITTSVGQASATQIAALFGKIAAKTKDLRRQHMATQPWVQSHLPTWLAAWPTSMQGWLRQDILDSLVSKAAVRIPNLQDAQGVVFDAENLRAHLNTAIQAGVYTALRRIYNHEHPVDASWQVAAWYAVRCLCYAGMFRFGPTGAFNVPYGGMAYNSRNFAPSMADMQSAPVVDFLSRTTLVEGDFAPVIAPSPQNPLPINGQSKTTPWGAQDFLFVDPPYDSAFSQYNSHGDFTAQDQQRLASLLTTITAPWMVVIKNTPMILGLYQAPHLHRAVFGKSYQVNIRNRHDRAVEHLIVTNYPLPTSTNITVLP